MPDLSWFKGEGTCWILGTGPSLTDESKRITAPTFGINASYRIRPSTWHVMIDNNSEHLQALGADNHRVFTMDTPTGTQLVRDYHNVWSWRPDIACVRRCSVYVAMQLAVFAGFDRIVLLGVDLVWDRKNRTDFMKAWPDYMDRWPTVVATQTRAYIDVMNIARNTGRFSIWNASPVSVVSQFPKVDFEEALTWPGREL